MRGDMENVQQQVLFFACTTICCILVKTPSLAFFKKVLKSCFLKIHFKERFLVPRSETERIVVPLVWRGQPDFR